MKPEQDEISFTEGLLPKLKKCLSGSWVPGRCEFIRHDLSCFRSKWPNEFGPTVALVSATGLAERVTVPVILRRNAQKNLSVFLGCRGTARRVLIGNKRDFSRSLS